MPRRRGRCRRSFGHYVVLTPLLMIIIMVAADFLAMSLTTDNVWPSPIPNAWRIGNLTIAGVIMGVCLLAFCTGVLAAGKFELDLGTGALRTLAFAALVLGSQATIYAIRQRRHLWGSRPSLWLAASSVADIVIASTLAGRHRNDPPARLDGSRHRCLSGCVCRHLGFGEGSGFSSA